MRTLNKIFFIPAVVSLLFIFFCGALWTVEAAKDKEIWGNKGIGEKGYFYPIKGPQLKKTAMEEKKIKKYPQKEEIDYKTKRELEIAQGMEKKAKREKEWCPKKERTVVPKENKVIVADFNSGTSINNMGYTFGAWDRDPADYSQMSIDSFIPSIKVGNTGYSLQLYYDVSSPTTAYNGFWCRLDGDIDYSVFSKVGFWVKGDPERKFTKVFKVELKNCINEIGIHYITDITDKWQEIVIPFDKFSGLTEWSLLKEFVITFEDRAATEKEGAIYIDNIYFEK